VELRDFYWPADQPLPPPERLAPEDASTRLQLFKLPTVRFSPFLRQQSIFLPTRAIQHPDPNSQPGNPDSMSVLPRPILNSQPTLQGILRTSVITCTDRQRRHTIDGSFPHGQSSVHFQVKGKCVDNRGQPIGRFLPTALTIRVPPVEDKVLQADVPVSAPSTSGQWPEYSQEDPFLQRLEAAVADYPDSGRAHVDHLLTMPTQLVTLPLSMDLASDVFDVDDSETHPSDHPEQTIQSVPSSEASPLSQDANEYPEPDPDILDEWIEDCQRHPMPSFVPTTSTWTAAMDWLDDILNIAIAWCVWTALCLITDMIFLPFRVISIYKGLKTDLRMRLSTSLALLPLLFTPLFGLLAWAIFAV
jgi:hypothetical protein